MPMLYNVLQGLPQSSRHLDHFMTVVDSHIHLFPESHLRNFNWYTPDGPLSKQHSVSDYKDAVTTAPFPKNSIHAGFVFVETDRKSSVSEENGGWEQPLEELKFLSRIATGTPEPGEGHRPDDSADCLAIVGWAPVPGGRQAMEKYEHRMRGAVAEETMGKVAGFRYLVQDKPSGTMLTEQFIDSLKWMGEKGYTFDLGVDMRSGGLWQLAEACIMISRVVANVPLEKQVKIVINHMCKPDMLGSPYAPRSFEPENERFVSWQRHLRQLAAFPNTYMKLSGALSEIPPFPSPEQQDRMTFWERQQMLLVVSEHVTSYIATAYDLFGSDRVMFGSDWPVCNISGGGNAHAFSNWMFIMRSFASQLKAEDQQKLWGQTAILVYNIRFSGPRPGVADVSRTQQTNA